MPRKVRVTVTMKRPWTVVSSWPHKPTVDEVIEYFANEIMTGRLDDLFTVDTEEK